MAALAERLGVLSLEAALSAVLAMDPATSAEFGRRWGTPPPPPPPPPPPLEPLRIPATAAVAVAPVETSVFWRAIRRRLGLTGQAASPVTPGVFRDAVPYARILCLYSTTLTQGLGHTGSTSVPCE